MAGPSSDFDALYEQRIEDSTNGQALKMPVAAPAIPAAQLLPKDLLPALRKAETPKEAARLEVHDFIEFETGRNRTPLPPQFQTASFFVTSSVNPFQMRKF